MKEIIFAVTLTFPSVDIFNGNVRLCEGGESLHIHIPVTAVLPGARAVSNSAKGILGLYPCKTMRGLKECFLIFWSLCQYGVS